METFPDDIAKELKRRATQEQRLRQTWEQNLDNEEIRNQVREVDKTNTTFLKEVVSRYGWPKISEVGEEAAEAAWLIAQHTPDKSFLKECLELMQASPSEVKSQNLARTIDRVKLSDGQKQHYGTHFTQDKDGNWEPLPIEDLAMVEERRAAMDLPTIEKKKQEYNS